MMDEPPTVFETLNEAIVYAFKLEQTSLLNLDRICAILGHPSLYLKSRCEAPVSCSTITRRRISSTLSSSDIFVRAGPPRTCLWALRPSNPLFLSDGALATSIEQMLTCHGPLTLEQFACLTDLSGADVSIFERFLAEHAHQYEKDADGTFWFSAQKRPTRTNFESMGQALLCSFAEFPDGASVEELHWLLCLSTVGSSKPITRRSVSRELSRRTDLFLHVSRARYMLLRKQPAPAVPAPPVCPVFPSVVAWEPATMNMPACQLVQVSGCQNGDDEFNPFAFFGGEFQFADQ
jgi:hypothetical protein